MAARIEAALRQKAGLVVGETSETVPPVPTDAEADDVAAAPEHDTSN